MSTSTRYIKAAASAGRAFQAAKGYEPSHRAGNSGRLPVIQSWQYALDYPEILETKWLVAEIEAVISQLEQKADNLQDQEKTLAGRLAAFVGFPTQVRAIVQEDHPKLGGVAAGAGVLVQLFVATVGEALALGLGAGCRRAVETDLLRDLLGVRRRKLGLPASCV